MSEMTDTQEMIKIQNLAKSFVLHNQGGVRIPVLANANLSVAKGECVVLSGPSGAGKSTLLRSVYANYLAESGSIMICHRGEWVDLVAAPPHKIMEIREHTLGYVSQFLRVIPRISTTDLVSEPLLIRGIEQSEARLRAAEILTRLAIPETLWGLPPATFSGGERQRVNIAMNFVREFPILLLDEPTASLDAANRDAVIDLIREARDNGVAIVGIFHDAYVREAVGTATYDVSEAREAA